MKVKIEKSVCTQFEMRLSHEDIVWIMRDFFINEMLRRGFEPMPTRNDVGVEFSTGGGKDHIIARVYVITKEIVQ